MRYVEELSAYLCNAVICALTLLSLPLPYLLYQC